MEKQIFNGVVRLKLDLVGEDWPEGVRLHALNSLGMFIELVSLVYSANGVLRSVFNSINFELRIGYVISPDSTTLILFE